MELTKATLDCMQKLRRRLRGELGTDIHLSQSNVIEALLAACKRSDSPETRKLGAQLAELTGLPGGGESARPQALYRGRMAAAQTDSTPAPAEERQVLIYRGQRIYV